MCIFNRLPILEKTAEETDEKLLLNEHVTLENFEKIRIGDPKTGEGV